MKDTAGPPPGKSETRKLTTFRALGYPGYRYLWLGQLGHSATMWMEQVVRPLLILELTGSPLQVGLVVALRMIPQLVFGLLAGVLADRYNKRLILQYSQAVTLLMHLVLALLLLSHRLEVWQVYVTAFISGTSMAFNQPARQSLIPRLVPPAVQLNALSLNTAAMNITRILGAGLAGVLLIFLDYGQVYLLNALIFGGVILSTARIRELPLAVVDKPEERPQVGAGPPAGAARPARTGLFSDFADGFRYISRQPVLFCLVGLGLLIFVFALPYQQVFIPLLALDVLETGRSGAGWLLAFSGIGALAGSLFIASLKRLNRRGLCLLALLVVLGLALALLAHSRQFALSALALMIIGGVSSAYFALSNSLLLEKSTPAYHGRVMSLMSLDRGLTSLGAVLAGALAESLGPVSGLTVLAVICVAGTLLMFLLVRPLRRIN